MRRKSARKREKTRLLVASGAPASDGRGRGSVTERGAGVA